MLPLAVGIVGGATKVHPAAQAALKLLGVQKRVETMLTMLDPRPGDRCLDVGAGSGWTTALLAHLVAPGGSVVGVEIVPELVELDLTADTSQAAVRALGTRMVEAGRVADLDAKATRVLEDYRMIQYDLSVGERWSEKAMFGDAPAG